MVPAIGARAVGGAKVLAALTWAAGLVLAVAPLAERQGVDLWGDRPARAGAALATWLAIVLVARRIAGPVLLVAALSGGCLVLISLWPRHWVLAGAAAFAAATYGVLGTLVTRPAAGLRSVREAVVATLVGAAGAVVVTGYDVALKPYRFRLLVLGLALAAALACAWRLGRGRSSLGRRGAALMSGAVVVLVASIVYVQLVRRWGSPEVVGSLTGTKGSLRDLLGASPRPIEALVGFPALVWGVSVRARRRQGWWMSAFGALAAGGVATSLAQRSVPLREVIEATGYGLALGVALGLLLIGLDTLLTGPGRRTRSASTPEPERWEPERTGSLVRAP